MKTTIEISDALLRHAKQLVAQRNTTLRAVLESALRDALERDSPAARARPVKTHTLRGEGLQPGVSWDAWSTPDPLRIHLELKKKGVTLELLHLEYPEAHPDGYRYTEFCDVYRLWRKRRTAADRPVSAEVARDAARRCASS